MTAPTQITQLFKREQSKPEQRGKLGRFPHLHRMAGMSQPHFDLTSSYIVQRLRTRVAEWHMAVVLTLSGIVLLLPGDTFQLPPYEPLREVASEGAWGAGLMVIGFIRLIVLAVNGALKRGVSPILRVLLSVAGLMVWSMLGWGYVLLGVPTLMMAMLTGAIAAEFVNIYRATEDARAGVDGG